MILPDVKDALESVIPSISFNGSTPFASQFTGITITVVDGIATAVVPDASLIEDNVIFVVTSGQTEEDEIKYNRRYELLTLDEFTDTITFQTSSIGDNDVLTSSTIRFNFHIYTAINTSRAEESYNKGEVSLWVTRYVSAFAAQNTGTVGNEISDADTGSIGQQNILDGVILVLFFPVTNEAAAVAAVDFITNTMIFAILNSLFGKNFLLEGGTNIQENAFVFNAVDIRYNNAFVVAEYDLGIRQSISISENGQVDPFSEVLGISLSGDGTPF